MPTVKSELDFSFFNMVEKKAKELNQITVEAGYYPTRIHLNSKLPLSVIAMLNEFGSTSRNRPARPFMLLAGVLFSQHNLKEAARACVNYLYKNKDAKTAFTPIGRLGVKMIQASIMTQQFAELSPATIERKGSAMKLVETSQLLNGAQWKITKE